MYFHFNMFACHIGTGLVEDYSGRGVADLKLGIIRTPLPALTTLQDDPLRVLRAVRFACRFQFDVSDDLLVAGADPSVHEALGAKVSRERVYAELELMMKSKHAARAAALLHCIQVTLLPIHAYHVHPS